MKTENLKNNVKSEVKKFVYTIITNTFLTIAIFSVFFSFVLSKKEVALGIIVGGGLSILNFFLMSRNSSELIEASLDERGGQKAVVGGFFLRYLFLIFALFFVFSSTNVNIIATLISLFSIQIVIFISQLWETRKV